MTISAIVTQYGQTIITVENGGKLVVDGGQLQNANICLQEGSQLHILNGGEIIIREGVNLNVPLSSTLNIEEGTIK